MSAQVQTGGLLVDRWFSAPSENESEIFSCWLADPVLFVWDNFRVVPDPWQADVLWEMAASQRLALPACKGAGKTCVLAWGILWFATLHNQSKVAVTSVSGENLRDNLWAELALWIGASPLLTRLWDAGGARIEYRSARKTWFISARKWSKSADEKAQGLTLAGIHADFVLLVIDEAGGVPIAVGAAAEGALANAEPGSRLVAKYWIAGNTTHREFLLGRAVLRDSHLWKVFHITGDPAAQKRAPRVSKTWAQQQIDQYGRDNVFVRINVLAEFPLSAINALISEEDVLKARRTQLPRVAFEWAAKVLGVDVAHEGDDRSVIVARQGLCCFRPKVFRLKRTEELGEQVIAAIRRFNPDAVFIDVTGGFGVGVADYVEKAGHRVYRVNFGASARGPQYLNKRAEMYSLVAKWLQDGGALPDMEEFMELAASHYAVTGKGQLQLEPKAYVKQTLGFSPDVADALVTTFAEDIVPAGVRDHAPVGRSADRKSAVERMEERRSARRANRERWRQQLAA